MKKVFIRSNEKYKWISKSNIDKYGMPKTIKSIMKIMTKKVFVKIPERK